MAETKIPIPETADIAPRFIPDVRLQVATAAMQGLLASGKTGGWESVAKRAVHYADELLAELNKEKK